MDQTKPLQQLKDKIGKNAGYVMLAISLIGLLSQLSNLIVFPGNQLSIYILRIYIEPVNLSLFQNRLFEYNTDGGRILFPNLIFYIVSLLGAILYIWSKGRESRLLRFSFSVVLISVSLRLLSSLFRVVFFVEYLKFIRPYEVLSLIFVLWVILSWWCLNYVNKSRQLQIETSPWPEDEGRPILVNATGNQRFFNFVTDTIFCVFIFSVFVGILPADTNTTLLIMMVGFRLVYYVFFETVFGATPAKFLTETRTLNVDGSKPGFIKILLRTLCRFVPFEPFSFLLVSGSDEGWHDRWTRTLVAKEQQTGVAGSRYLLLILAFILLGVGAYFSNEWYEDHRSYLYDKERYEQRIQEIEHGLNNLSEQTIIKLKGDDFSSDATFLQPVSVDAPGSHLYNVLNIKDEYQYNIVAIGEVMKQGYLQQVSIADKLLREAITKDYDHYKEQKLNAADLLGDGKLYKIETVATMYRPILRTGSASSSSSLSKIGNIALGLDNHGWKSKLVEIKNVKGSIEWDNILPQEIEGASDKNYFRGYLSLTGTQSSGYIGKYEVIITFENDRGERNVYRIKGKGVSWTLTEVN